jgi:calcium permeable stress-gated cation channel
MVVTPAPNPADLFWRNIGLPHQAKRSGVLAAIAATTALCFFWSIPMGFVATLTKVTRLKTKLPKLGDWLEDNLWAEGFFSQLAPLILLFFNEVILPYILKYFATWEGHISTAILEASLFNKLCCFMIIQTFFVSALSGGITDEITSIIDRPNHLVDILADSLPAQSTYFIQICLGTTFFMQSIEMLRLYPLSVALLRRCFGPNATKQERQQVWWWFHPLSDPPDFWHAETFAQLILFYMVFFVYNTIAPVVSFFLLACFLLIEAGYRYQFIHNYPRSFGK